MGRKIGATVSAGLQRFRGRQKGHSGMFNSFLAEPGGTEAKISGSKCVDVSSAELHQQNEIANSFGALLLLLECDGDKTWHEPAPGWIDQHQGAQKVRNEESGARLDN
jgi:hypothetical protein